MPPERTVKVCNVSLWRAWYFTSPHPLTTLFEFMWVQNLKITWQLCVTKLLIILKITKICSRYTVFLKVAFSTFWFKFGATLRRQAERRDSGTRQKASNLAQPLASLLPYTKFWYSALCLAPLGCRQAWCRLLLDARSGVPRSKRHQAWRPFSWVTLGWVRLGALCLAPLGLTTEGSTKFKLKGWKCYLKNYSVRPC